MITTETKKNVAEIGKLMEELDHLNDENIRSFCDERKLDYDCFRDYSYAAMMVCEYVRPLTFHEASLILKHRGDELLSRNSGYCKDSEDGYNEGEDNSDEVSLYGFLKQLERAVKKGRSSVQRRGRNIRDKTDVSYDGEGGWNVGIITPRDEFQDRLKKEKNKAIDRAKKEAELGALRLLSNNLRRISEDYDRCKRESQRGADGPEDQKYLAKKEKCSDRAMYQTRNVLRPAQAMLKDSEYRGLIKLITTQSTYRDMRDQLKDLRDFAEKYFKKQFNEYHRFFDWLK